MAGVLKLFEYKLHCILLDFVAKSERWAQTSSKQKTHNHEKLARFC